MSLAIDGQRSDKSLLWFFLFLKELGPFKKSLNPMIPMIRKLKKKHFEKYSKDKISFFDFVDLLGWGTWGDYLRQRFSCSSFWNLYPFMPIVKEKNDMVFDFLCGAGHGSYVISQNARPKTHVCADLDYTLLFIAKKYFAPQAQFLCIDANDRTMVPSFGFTFIMHFQRTRVKVIRSPHPNGPILWGMWPPPHCQKIM
jgi:SAM-dependent methyltransferase